MFTLFGCKKPTDFLDFETIQIQDDITLRKVLFISEDIGFAAGGKRFEHGYLYKTNNGGDTWELKHDVVDYNLYEVFFIDSLNGVLVGESMRYYYTEDGGDTWTRKYMWPNLPYFQKDMSDFKKVIQYNDSILLMVCGDDYNEGLVFKISTDHKTWTFEEKEHELKGITKYNKAVFVSGFGYIGEYSFDADSVYQMEKHGDFYVGIHAFSETDLLMAGNGGKFYQSKDRGASWKIIERKSRLNAKRWIINEMLFVNSSEGICVGDYGLVLYSSDKGENWKEFRLANDIMLYSVSEKNGNLFLTSDEGRIIKIALEKLRE